MQVPAPFNLEAVIKAKQDDPSALHVVLFQEVRGLTIAFSTEERRNNIMALLCCGSPRGAPFKSLTLPSVCVWYVLSPD